MLAIEIRSGRGGGGGSAMARRQLGRQPVDASALCAHSGSLGIPAWVGRLRVRTAVVALPAPALCAPRAALRRVLSGSTGPGRAALAAAQSGGAGAATMRWRRMLGRGDAAVYPENQE